MSFIPEVKMDFIPSDEEEEENTGQVEEETNEETGEVNPNFEYEEEEAEEEKVSEQIPEPKRKGGDMNIEDIFDNKAEVKLTKKGKPRKKRPPMSEEHKKKLALAREKAMAVRQAKAKEKKENKDLEKQEKELLKKQKVKRVQKLKKEVEEDSNTKPQIREADYPVSTITKKDLEEAQLDAIIKYETIRKQRKKEKQEKQVKEKQEAQIRETLMRAVAPKKQEYNPFDGCY